MYDPLNHYWVVATNPTQRWAGARGIYVDVSDAEYIAWDAADNDATNIPTEDELWEVIAQIALTVYLGGQGYGVDIYNTSATINLPNPLPTTVYVIPGAPLDVILPQANLPVSRPIGVSFQIANSTEHLITIKTFTGGIVSTIKRGEIREIFPVSFASAGGSYGAYLKFVGNSADLSSGVSGSKGGHADTIKANGDILIYDNTNPTFFTTVAKSTDGTFASNSDLKIPTEKAVRTYALAAGGLGVGVSNALQNNVGSAGAFVTFNGALGTPSSATLTNATGLPVGTGISGLGAGVGTFLATPSSTNLAASVTGKTGTGSLVFATSPALVTPTGIVKGDVGLGNVDNTSDADKPVSTAQQAALDLKLAVSASSERLTAARTYYVRADGSNSNTGLANTAGGAFLTIQKAIDVVLATLDLNGFNITIQVADGTYTSRVNFLSPQIGAGVITIQGNSSTPANVVISTTGAAGAPGSSDAAFKCSGAGVKLVVKNLKIETTTNGSCLYAEIGADIAFSNLVFHTCARFHTEAASNGHIRVIGAYTITGNASRHFFAVYGGIIDTDLVTRTVTVTGTPAITQFALIVGLSCLDCFGLTFSGATTGTRYVSAENSQIQTYGGGANYFPGSVAGSTSTGGLYA